MELRGWGNAKIFVREFLSLIHSLQNQHIDVGATRAAGGKCAAASLPRLIAGLQCTAKFNCIKNGFKTVFQIGNNRIRGFIKKAAAFF